jgi:hypothetical protein
LKLILVNDRQNVHGVGFAQVHAELSLAQRGIAYRLRPQLIAWCIRSAGISLELRYSSAF